MRKILAVCIISMMVLPVLVLAQGGGVKIDNPIKAQDFKTLLKTIADGIFTVIAGLSVIMIMVAGILFLLSAGSPEKINTAKACLTYAIIGAAVALAAKAIIATVTSVFGI